MDDKTNHPFQPGARVAIDTGCKWREGRVDKAYKNGCFTLVGASQQWRPYHWCHDDSWHANATGPQNVWSRARLHLWDATTDADIKAIFDNQARVMRCSQLITRIHKLKDDEITNAMLDQIEAALPATETLA